MIRIALTSALALVLSLGSAPLARARIAGGGPPATDCYSEFDGVTATGTNPVRVDCQDGDPTCDVDGLADGKCTFSLTQCILQSDVAGCTPVPITSIKAKSLTKASRFVIVPLQSPADLTVAGCSPAAAEIVIPLGGKNHTKPKTKKFTLVAITGAAGKLKKDSDKLILSCKPGGGKCPDNPAGGPNEFKFEITSPGDLDNGWTGNSFNNPNVVGTVLRVCLNTCNAASSSPCLSDDTASNGVNGTSFGAPLPLIASNVPVCVINRYSTPKVSGGTIDFASGDLNMTVNLLSDVIITQTPSICPVCSGTNLGDQGKCDGTSTRAGSDCTVDGIITVGSLTPPKRFTLSTQCPPKGSPAGTLTIPLALTTGTSTKPGPKPCGESTDDGCAAAGPCNAACVGPTTCPTKDAQNQCIDSRGGISQVCCAGNQNISCHPTSVASGTLPISRDGAKTIPTPPVPDATFPKCGTATLASVFCEAATTSNVVNTVTGLPGPGAALLPVKWEVKQASSTSCP